MKNYSKNKLHFDLSSHQMFVIFLGCLLLVTLCFICTLKPDSHYINFVLVIGVLIAAVVVSSFVILLPQQKKLSDFKIGSYAHLLSLIYCNEGRGCEKICAVFVPADKKFLSEKFTPKDFVIVAVNDRFMRRLHLDSLELEKVTHPRLTIRFVEKAGEISVTDQNEGVLSLVLANCFPPSGNTAGQRVPSAVTN